MILRLSMDLPEDTAYIRPTRILSQCLLEAVKVKRDIIEDVETIVAELCSNVIRHAHSQATRFEITLEYYKPKIVITVTDKGQGFSPEDVPPVGTWRSDGEGGKRLGGYGLSLLEGLSDKVDFTETDPHGSTVRVEKTLSYETQEAADEATEHDTDSGAGVKASTD